MTTSQIIATLLYICAAFSLYLCITELIRRFHQKESRLFALLAFSSTWWSFCFGMMYVQLIPYQAFIWRNIGMAGVFAYMILICFLLVMFMKPPKKLRYFIMGFSLLGIPIYPLTTLENGAVYTYGKTGMTYRLTPIWANNIYSAYTVVLLLLLFLSIIYMLITEQRRSKRILGIGLLSVGIIIATGTMLDTIMPMFGFASFPGSSLSQFLGTVFMYITLKTYTTTGLTVRNMSDYIYYSVSTPVYICDENLQIQIVNQSGYEFLHMDEQQCLNLTIKDIFPLDENELDCNTLNLPEARCAINNTICNVNISRIKNTFGDIIGYIAVADDLSDKMKYIEELARSKEQADAANAAKSRFLANMSHEIRTPMHAITGFSELILKENISDEVRKNIQHVKEASQNLLSIINDILDFSKIESGKMELLEIPYYTSALLKDAIVIISNQADAKGLRFESELDETLPRKLCGDKVRLRSILINVLNNAIKYTDKGTVHFSVGHRYIASDMIEFIFTIKDTGIGMQSEDIEHLFEAFRRFDQNTNYGVEGSGLGLAICNAYVKMMGGEIQVESTYGEGSTFRVLVRQKVLEHEPVDMEFVHHTLPDAGELHIRNQEILVVDDNLVNLLVAEGLLKSYGSHVDTADGGQASIDACTKKEYNLIFMDQMMPDVDGTMALKEIRKISPYYAKEAKIITLTADAIEGMREHFLSEGFDEYLSKPIEVGKLERIFKMFVPEDCIYYE